MGGTKNGSISGTQRRRRSQRSRGRTREEGELDMGPPYFGEGARWGPREGAAGARRGSGPRRGASSQHRALLPLAVRTTKMWEYTGITDPDQVSTAAVTDGEV
jgi:hypothetical protein